MVKIYSGMKKSSVISFFVLLSISVSAHVNLLRPQAGDSFEPGASMNIEWEIVIPHETENWDLFFSHDGVITWEPIALDLAPGTLSYLWTVPEQGTTMGKVRVVQDNLGTDYSDESGLFTINGTVGIEEPKHAPGLRVYPNPADDRFFISVKNTGPGVTSIKFYTSSGKLMLSEEIASGNDGANKYIDVSFLPPGIYVLTMESPSVTETEKIIIR